MIRTKGNCIAFTAIALALSVAANAQDEKRSKSRATPIHESLNLSDEQRPRFLSIQKAMTAKWAELRKMDPEKRKTEQANFYKAKFAEIEALLTPQQLTLYRELRKQRSRVSNNLQSEILKAKPNEEPRSVDAATGREQGGVFKLAEIDGRTWLITPQGKPFFAHGITHTTNRSLSDDYSTVAKACKDLGFNSYGYGCPDELKTDMPYVEGRNYVPISTYRGKGGSFRFIDIFDPSVQQRLTQQVKQTCLQNRNNPNLIGYYWTDLGAWPLKNSVGKNWVDFIRDLPADAHGQKAYADFLKTWKGEDTKARDLAFLRLIAREYFRVMGAANKKHDPDHLIFGDRFAFNTIVPEVLQELVPWVDAIAIQPNFQPGFPKANYQEIHELTGKPILICDFAIRFKDGDKKIRGWNLQEDARSAGVEYAKYIHAALETPYIIGAFWCNPVDSTGAFNKSGGLKQGLFGDGLTPRPGLAEAVTELNRHIAQVTPGSTKSP